MRNAIANWLRNLANFISPLRTKQVSIVCDTSDWFTAIASITGNLAKLKPAHTIGQLQKRAIIEEFNLWPDQDLLEQLWAIAQDKGDAASLALLAIKMEHVGLDKANRIHAQMIRLLVEDLSLNTAHDYAGITSEADIVLYFYAIKRKIKKLRDEQKSK